MAKFKFLPVVLAFFVAYPTVVAAASSQTSFAPPENNGCAANEMLVVLPNGSLECELTSRRCPGGEGRRYLDSKVCLRLCYFSASLSLTTASNPEPELRAEMLPAHQLPALFRPANESRRGKCSMALSIVKHLIPFSAARTAHRG
jgi:hypothetical protein